MYYLLRSKDQKTITVGASIPDGYYAVKEYTIPFDFNKFLKDSSLEEAKLSLRGAKFALEIDPNNKYYSEQLKKQQEEQAVQGIQRMLHLQLYQKKQQKQFDDDLKIIRHLNNEINKLDKLIDLARQ
jgi:hypothetical protein